VWRLGHNFVRRYHRLTIDIQTGDLDGPVLFLASHGFGGVFHLNVFATTSALEQFELQRPLTILTHPVAWTFRVGPLLEPFGARPASREDAQ
jgi:hypothetical protein